MFKRLTRVCLPHTLSVYPFLFYLRTQIKFVVRSKESIADFKLFFPTGNVLVLIITCTPYYMFCDNFKAVIRTSGYWSDIIKIDVIWRPY